MSSREKYGWYSKEQHMRLSEMVGYRVARRDRNGGGEYWTTQEHNCYIYQTENGDEVLCTEVTSTPEYPTSKFDDFVPLGKVVKYVKQCYAEVQ